MTASPKQVLHQYPDSWTPHLHTLASRLTLNVTGHATTIDVTTDQLQSVYFPLLAMLGDLVRPDVRVLAGLAGIPGSGKTTLGCVLAYIARIVFPPDHFAVVGLDGWHLPNRVLDQRTMVDRAGNCIPLRQRKGSPESFDVATFAQALQTLRDPAQTVALPVYDRQRHDPVPEGLTLAARTRIVLIEGNYLLCTTPPWNEVRVLLHPMLYLDCDRTTAHQRVIARHLRGGCTSKEAIAKFENNDRPNTNIVLKSHSHADFCIQLTEPVQIRKLDVDPPNV